MMKNVYGDDCLSRTTVFKWHKRVLDGHQVLIDNDRPGKPVVFYDSKGIIHREFILQGQPVTGSFYLSVMRRLMVRIRRIRLDYRNPERWCLLHDNAPSNLLIVTQFLAKSHSPYSPDLAPRDSFLFPKLKMPLKGCYFDDIETIQRAYTRALEAIQQIELKQSFKSLFNRCQKCIESEGDYFRINKKHKLKKNYLFLLNNISPGVQLSYQWYVDYIHKFTIS